MMKKNVFALLLAGLLMICLTGCGAKESAKQTDDNNPADSITADVTSDTSEEKKSDDIPAVENAEPQPETPPRTTEKEEQQTVREPAKISQTEAPKAENPTTAQTPESVTAAKPEKKPETPEETTPPAAEKLVVETVPKASKEDCREIAQKVLEYINSYRSTPAVKLTGLTEYAEYRSRQLVVNFAHDTDDERAAATALSYGEYVEPALYGMTGEPYYTAGAREAIAKAGYAGTVNEVAQKLAQLIKNSQKHWAYVGNSNYQYIAVGVTYESGMWYCDVAMTMENTDNH